MFYNIEFYYGILGAIVFRAVFVGVGSAMLRIMGPWAEIIFGAAIGYAAYQMLSAEDEEDEEPDYENMFLVKMFNKATQFSGLSVIDFLFLEMKPKSREKIRV